MSKPIRVLYVHDVNVKNSSWQLGWTQAIETGFKHAGSQVQTEPYENEYRASNPSATLTAFGATRREAVRNLEDLALATMEVCASVGPGRLGPGPARQFKALQIILGAR